MSAPHPIYTTRRAGMCVEVVCVEPGGAESVLITYPGARADVALAVARRLTQSAADRAAGVVEVSPCLAGTCRDAGCCTCAEIERERRTRSGR